MRGKRSKQYKKLMQQYSHFGFREPYQVVVDAQIIQDAARFKMDFISGLGKCLHGEVKPMITQCSIRHLYAAEPKDSIVLEHAKAFERRRCNHHTLEQPLSTLECLSSVVDPKGSKINKHRLVVASQDDTVRGHMRKIPGVPLIYIKRSVMIMEPMSGATEEIRNQEERLKFRAGLKGRIGADRGLKRGRKDADDEAGSSEENDGQKQTGSAAGLSLEAGSEPVRKKRKRGPSQPNPLSIKRAKQPLASTKTKPKPIDSVSTITSTLPAGPSIPGVEAPLDEVAKHKRKRKHKSNKEDETSAATTAAIETASP